MRTPILDELYKAMGALYEARYIATGPEGPVDGKHYPEMDRQTVENITSLQTKLQTLISRLEKEKKMSNQAQVSEVRKDWEKMTPWQQFKAYKEHSDGGHHYYQAELVAVHRAIYILKQLEPGEKMIYKTLMTRAVEYADQFPGIGAKYRDTTPRIELLADYGVLVFDGDPEDWDKTTVRLTAKGFLARPEEWYEEKDSAIGDEDHDFSFMKELEKL